MVGVLLAGLYKKKIARNVVYREKNREARRSGRYRLCAPQTSMNANTQVSLLVHGAATSISNLHARWWVKAGVGRCSVSALLDLGATHTIMGSIGLQIAFDCGETVNPIFNLKAYMINGDKEEIIGRVELPIEIAGVKHNMKVFITTIG